MKNCKPVSNPYPSVTIPSTKNLTKTIDPIFHMSTIGALQYLNITRPNISFLVNIACQTMHNPTFDDWMKVKHILRYLKGTVLEGL